MDRIFQDNPAMRERPRLHQSTGGMNSSFNVPGSGPAVAEVPLERLLHRSRGLTEGFKGAVPIKVYNLPVGGLSGLFREPVVSGKQSQVEVLKEANTAETDPKQKDRKSKTVTFDLKPSAGLTKTVTRQNLERALKSYKFRSLVKD